MTDAGRWRLWAAAVAVLLAAADTYVVVLALPDIMAGVGLTTADLQQAAPIVSAFLLGYVALLPLVGRLSDVRGRLPTLAWCLVVFAAGSCFTAGAHGLPLVVVGRFLQGLGGGGLVPVTLALVADLWPEERRALPLGVVGAVQELGSLVGPLYGAAIVAWQGWRAIFWINAAGGAALAAVLALGRHAARERPGVRDVPGAVLVLATVAGVLLLLARPASLVDSVRWGGVYLPVTGPGGSPLAAPLTLATAGLGAAWLVRELTAPRPLVPLRGIRRLAGTVDVGGAALVAVALGCIIVTFSTADPSRQVMVSFGPELLALAALALAAFVWHERRTPDPLVEFAQFRDRAAVGALASSLCLGAALMAALVDIPLFARSTVFPNSQLDAALVLVRFLVGVPIGAVLGGAVTARLTHRVTAGGGLLLATAGFLLMARWGPHALETSGIGASDAVLFVTGLGFGLAAAPVNAAALAAVQAHVHGLVTSLIVVARTVGMLVGLSVLTAVGLRQFYAHAPSALKLCHGAPDCAAYDAALRRAAIAELHVVFFGAAVAAALAALFALTLLRRSRPATH